MPDKILDLFNRFSATYFTVIGKQMQYNLSIIRSSILESTNQHHSGTQHLEPII